MTRGPNLDANDRLVESACACLSRCPWCGARGVDFDESPRPSDYCGHDPALCAPDRPLSLETTGDPRSANSAAPELPK